MKFYTRGVKPNHPAVLLIRCGIDKDIMNNLWLIQNSWGMRCGVNNYTKIIRNSSLPERRMSCYQD